MTELAGTALALKDKHARRENIAEELRALGGKAHGLYVQLQRDGHDIRFSKMMLQNRGVSPSDPEFFNSLHAIEDFMGSLNGLGLTVPSTEDRVRSLLEVLDPANLRHLGYGPEHVLTQDKLDEITSLLEESVSDVPDAEYDAFCQRLREIDSLFDDPAIRALVEFKFASFEQAEFERHDTSEGENVSAASEDANHAAIDRCNELVESSADRMTAAATRIRTFLNDVESAKEQNDS